MSNYVIITPVRNEELYLQKTIDSVVSQTLQPRRWIIVNDGSTDKTGVIIDTAARKHAWIQAVHRPDRGFRKQGGGVIEAFYDGYALFSTPNSQLSTSNPPWDFLVKLDGDLSFEPNYFTACLEQFTTNPKLGIGGGTVCRREGITLVAEAGNDPRFHVRGATKIYRRACWEQIEGLIKAPGWDTVDELKANMLGWRTLTFPGLNLLQHKDTGSADGAWRNSVKNGLANYISAYHPLFMMAKCLKRVFARPYLLGSAGLAWGFISGYLRQPARITDAALTRYIRTQQIRKLTRRPSLWD